MSTKIQYDLELPGLSDVADITVISNDIQKIADELDLRPRMVDGVIPFEILFSHKDAALTILNETDVYSQLINSGTQYINFIDTNGENTALIKKERTSGNNGDNTLSILLRGINGNYYGMTIHDNGLAQRITGVTPTVSGLDDETIPTMNYLNSNKATKLVHIDLAETITGSKTFTSQPIMMRDDDNLVLANPNADVGTIPASNKAIAMLFRGASGYGNYGFVGYVAGNDGSGLIRHRAYNYNRSASADLLVKCYADGSKWAECPTPPANAPSNAIVTKAEVYGTDNLSNNLVHTIGDEIVDGHKYMELPTMCNISGATNRIRGVFRFGLASDTTSYYVNMIFSQRYGFSFARITVTPSDYANSNSYEKLDVRNGDSNSYDIGFTVDGDGYLWLAIRKTSSAGQGMWSIYAGGMRGTSAFHPTPTKDIVDLTDYGITVIGRA